MIPRDFITAWRSEAPWVQDRQVEQDLVISQVPRGRRGAAYIVVPGLLTRAPGYALLRGSFVSRNKA
jgi:hypothetical protein